ncbi:MAG: AbrB/MazE/SpoVT family DNA-binding domain-containing protein [Beijerinckiaceae bacterium]|nr:AbrB/MazE/SpoVT family DNA-binding domain-containing protein [Beijerinckiaceae bacterium]
MQAVVDKAGRIILPKDVSDKLGLAPGNVVDVLADDHGAAIIRKASGIATTNPDRFERLRGSLKLDMTTDEFMAMMRGDD